MTEGVGAGVDLAENIYKNLVWDNILLAAETLLYGYVPFLNVPPLNWIINTCLQKFWDQLFKIQKLLIDVSVIKFKDAIHQNAFDQASLKLKIVSVEGGFGSAEYQEALKNEKAAFSKFIGVIR